MYILSIRILCYYKEFRGQRHGTLKKVIQFREISETYPMGSFDGAAQAGMGGCKIYLRFNSELSLNGWLGIGSSTNTRA